jgi:hypothetical protein
MRKPPKVDKSLLGEGTPESLGGMSETSLSPPKAPRAKKTLKGTSKTPVQRKRYV